MIGSKCFGLLNCIAVVAFIPAVGEADAVPYVKAVYSIPKTIDPIQMNDTSSLVVSNLIFDGLLKFAPSLELEPALASKWEILNDGKKYVFTLREAASFHDGSPITAEDVVISLSRTVSPASTVFKYYDSIKGASEFHAGRSKSVSGIYSKNGKVVIELTHAFPPFLSILAGATAKILPSRLLSAEDFFEKPVGSGPFKITGVDQDGGKLRLKRFDGYYGTKPKLENLDLLKSSEADAIKLAAAGKVDDLANFPLSGSEQVFNATAPIISPVAATWIIGLNTRRSPLNDLATRRAFRDAFDPELFRKKFQPAAMPAYGYVPFGIPGYKATSVKIESNISRPSRALIEIAVPRVLSRQAEMRTEIERQFHAKGWNVRAVPMDWTELIKAYDDKKLQAFLLSMNMDYPDPEFLIRNFESNNPDNFSGLSNKKLDQLIELTRQTQDRKVRHGINAEALDLIDQSAVTINLLHPRAFIWKRSCVEGLEPNGLADYYIDYAKVSNAHCSEITK